MQTGNYTSSTHEYIHIIAVKVDIPEHFLFFLFARNFFFLKSHAGSDFSSSFVKQLKCKWKSRGGIGSVSNKVYSNLDYRES